MAEFTGVVGPARNLDGPLPVAPEYRLLSVPGVLVTGEGHWLNGVNVWGYPEGVPFLWDPCSAHPISSDAAFKEEVSDWQSPRFDSFVAYFPITCSTISGDPAEFARRVEAVMQATLSYAVEQALAQGAPNGTNPFFGDANLVQHGPDGVSADIGLSFLENAIGQTGRKGLIHATPGTVSAWGLMKLRTEESLLTANGTPVASGGGYWNTDPTGLTGSNPASGVEWAFATGPVSVYVVDGPVLNPSQYVERSDNTITYRAEKYVLATWDTSLQAGVLIDWTT